MRDDQWHKCLETPIHSCSMSGQEDYTWRALFTRGTRGHGYTGLWRDALSDVASVQALQTRLLENDADRALFLQEKTNTAGELMGLLHENDDALTHAKITLLLALVNDPWQARAKILEYPPSASHRATFMRLLERVTREAIDPLPDEYNYPDRYTFVPRFPRTGRPLSYMRQIATVRYPQVTPDAVYWPVVRYQQRSGRGMWYAELTGSMQAGCFTFFYYEPDAITYLSVGRMLVAANKLHAALMLTGKLTATPHRRTLEFDAVMHRFDNSLGAYILEQAERKYGFADPVIAAFRELNQTISRLGTHGILNRSMVNVPEAFDAISTNPASIKMLYLDGQTTGPIYHITAAYTDTNRRYVGDLFVGAWDDLDALICDLAREAGYSTVLLQCEPGSTRAVTELLDTRPRTEVLDSIVRQVDRPPHQTAQDFPTAWFPNLDPPRVFIKSQ